MAGKIVFSDEYEENSLVLMQVDEHVLDAIQTGKHICFNASGNEHAVLCTDNRTYAVKFADVSNAHYLLPPATSTGDPLAFPPDQHRQVNTNIATYLELRHVDPKVTHIDALLKQCLYTGPDEEQSKASTPKFTTESLLDHVQASRQEILSRLQAIYAVEIDGYWRLLDQRYKFEIMDLILKTAAAEEWPLDKIPEKECAHSLSDCDIPAFIIRAVLKEYGIPSSVDEDDQHATHWALDEAAVCRFRACEFLQLGSSWDYESFMDTWSAALPESMTAKPEYLKGLALVSRKSEVDDRRIVQFFPAWTLPTDAKSRFDLLFKAQPVWTADEIEPYLRDIVSKLQTKEMLLLKYARPFEGRDGIRLYNQK
eukprot:m.249961 g.249961  ORF g.249961 m.249961 type:complete len:368 (+) comp17171_c0_seq2:143-1246(+)